MCYWLKEFKRKDRTYSHSQMPTHKEDQKILSTAPKISTCLCNPPSMQFAIIYHWPPIHHTKNQWNLSPSSTTWNESYHQGSSQSSMISFSWKSNWVEVDPWSKTKNPQQQQIYLDLLFFWLLLSSDRSQLGRQKPNCFDSFSA